MELLRKRAQRLGEQHDLCRRHRKLASARAQHGASGAHPVAEVELLDRLKRLVSEHVDASEELDLAAAVPDDEEDDLALVALGDEPAGETDDVLGLGAGLKTNVALLEVGGVVRDVPAVAVRLDTGDVESVELRSANGEGVV